MYSCLLSSYAHISELVHVESRFILVAVMRLMNVCALYVSREVSRKLYVTDCPERRCLLMLKQSTVQFTVLQGTALLRPLLSEILLSCTQSCRIGWNGVLLLAVVLSIFSALGLKTGAQWVV